MQAQKGEGNQMKVSAENILTLLCVAADEHRSAELPGTNVGYPIDEICEAVAKVKGASNKVPAATADVLNIARGSSYVEAATIVLAAFREPYPPMTTEEALEEEREVRKLSAAMEEINAQNPDMPQVPVPFPTENKRRQ
jgi:hypothetical protein